MPKCDFNKVAELSSFNFKFHIRLTFFVVAEELYL